MPRCRTHGYAAENRSSPPAGEAAALAWFRELGIPVAHQVPVGRAWILDFVDIERTVVYEIDGRQHQNDAWQQDADADRDFALTSAGLTVLRLANASIFARSPHALARIRKARRLAPDVRGCIDPAILSDLRSGLKSGGYEVPEWAKGRRRLWIRP